MPTMGVRGELPEDAHAPCVNNQLPEGDQSSRCGGCPGRDPFGHYGAGLTHGSILASSHGSPATAYHFKVTGRAEEGGSLRL